MEMLTPTVDIYLSAGPVTDTTDDPTYRSCDLDNVANCRIYRVAWNFSTMKAVEAEEILAPNAASDFVEGPCGHGLGRIQPAISPDGTRLAWAAACHATTSYVRYQRIAVQAADGGDVTYVSPPGGRRVFPEWRDEDTLLIGTDSTGGTVWSMDASSGVGTGLVGPDMVGGRGDYKNPRMHRAPEYKTPGGDGPRMATFGLRHTTGLLQPLVSKLDGTAHEEFDMGADPEFLECHHPAWNPDGTAIVCQREARATRPGPFEEKGLYRFEWSSGTQQWENMDELFASLDEGELEVMMGPDANEYPLFPASTTGTPFCQTRAWKSPQWCHSEGFVVVTLTCSYTRQVPDVFGFGIFTSRVVLVDFRDRDAPILYDVTRELERLLNLDSGSYRAIFATCGTPL